MGENCVSYSCWCFSYQFITFWHDIITWQIFENNYQIKTKFNQDLHQLYFKQYFFSENIYSSFRFNIQNITNFIGHRKVLIFVYWILNIFSIEFLWYLRFCKYTVLINKVFSFTYFLYTFLYKKKTVFL